MNNRTLLLLLLLAYNLMIIYTGFGELPLFMVFVMSIFSFYSIWNILFFVLGITGISIIFYYLVKKPMKNLYHDKWLIVSMLFILYPLFIVRNKATIEPEFRHGVYYFIPELIFYILYIMVMWKLLIKPKSSRLSMHPGKALDASK